MPKKPGEGELWAAEDFIRSYKDKEASGNTPEAIAFAENYAKTLRTSRELLFTEGKKGGLSLTKGHFLTYCFQKDDSLAVLVHVPELRRYTPEAKASLAEFSWMLASAETRKRFPNIKHLAVALKGTLNYGAIFTGTVTTGTDSLKDIQKRHPETDSEALWIYFDGSKPTP